MSGQFLSELRVSRLIGAREWVLTAELAYSSDVLGRVLAVPVGFCTDFASVPRLPFAYLFFDGVADEAAVIHDYLYSTGICSRKVADEVFAEACKASGVAAWRRGAVWLGVRLFGGPRYAGKVAQ